MDTASYWVRWALPVNSSRKASAHCTTFWSNYHGRAPHSSGHRIPALPVFPLHRLAAQRRPHHSCETLKSSKATNIICIDRSSIALNSPVASCPHHRRQRAADEEGRHPPHRTGAAARKRIGRTGGLTKLNAPDVGPSWTGRWVEGRHTGRLEVGHVAGDDNHAVYTRRRGDQPVTYGARTWHMESALRCATTESTTRMRSSKAVRT